MKRTVCIALAVSLTAGCAIGPRVDELPPVPVEPTWKHAPAPGIPDAQDAPDRAEAWWLRFEDPELSRFIAMAAQENLDLQVALARRDAARALSDEASAGWWPTLNVNAQSRRAKVSRREFLRGGDGGDEAAIAAPENPATRHSIDVESNYEVDLWGRVRSGIVAGRAEFRATEHDARAARIAVTAEIAAQYFSVRAADTLAALRSQREALLRDIVRRERDRLRAGVSDADTLLRAERDLLQLQEDNTALVRDRAAAENSLAILLGQAPMQFELASRADWRAPTIAPTAFMPAAVLESRPDIAAMAERMRAANARIGEARAARFPQLSLTDAAGYASDALSRLIRGDSFEWSFGPALQIPLFNGGRLRAREQGAIAQATQARVEYRQTALRAFEEVENALASIAAARAREQAARDTLQSLGKSSSLLQSQLAVGRISRLPLLLTQAEELTAHETTLRAQLEALEAHISLMRALGGG